MATAMYANMLEYLQHTTLINPRTLIYAFNMFQFSFLGQSACQHGLIICCHWSVNVCIIRDYLDIWTQATGSQDFTALMQSERFKSYTFHWSIRRACRQSLFQHTVTTQHPTMWSHEAINFSTHRAMECV